MKGIWGDFVIFEAAFSASIVALNSILFEQHFLLKLATISKQIETNELSDFVKYLYKLLQGDIVNFRD